MSEAKSPRRLFSPDWRMLAFLLLPAALVALASSSCAGNDCTPGRQNTCACPGAKIVGYQVCGDDGTWAACKCDGGEGGGTTTSSSTQTDTGTTGSGGSTSTGSGGEGGSACASPKLLCGNDCVDPQTDKAHCGECDHACPAVATCAEGVCVCPDNKVTCGSSCVDAQNDAKNCGGCGHDCLGASCTAGFCPAEPIVIGVDQPYSIALDATHIYWTSAGAENKVRRRPLAMSGTEDLATGQNLPRELAIDLANNQLFWSNYGQTTDAQVMALTIGSGPAAGLVSNEKKGVWGLAMLNDNVYFANQLEGTISRESVSTPAGPQVLALQQATPWDVAVDGQYVYWTNYDGGDVRRVGIGGGQQEVLASGQGNPVGIAIDATHVYWATETSGEINRVPLAGGTVEPIASGQTKPTYVAVDASNVYWTNFDNGTVARAPVAGGDVVVVAAGQNKPYYVLVDATQVYWTTLAGGTIMRAPK